jgi:hypothetical protein
MAKVVLQIVNVLLVSVLMEFAVILPVMELVRPAIYLAQLEPVKLV